MSHLSAVALCAGLLGAPPVEYEPLATIHNGGTVIQAQLHLASRVELASAFSVDLDGSEMSAEAATDVLARVGLSWNTRRALAPIGLGIKLEVDAITGIVHGAPTLEGVALPNAQGTENVLREANLRVSLGRYLHLIGGYMTSNFGMGLVANDGRRGWEPGNALFHDPRGGDRVLRVLLATGPVTDAGLTVGLGWDEVQADDVLLDSDKANQAVLAVRLGAGQKVSGGVYVAYRRQRADDGATLNGVAVDGTVRAEVGVGEDMTLVLEAEAVAVVGRTTLGPTTDIPAHDVTQLGGALRASLDAGSAGAVLDLLAASGDQNLDDAEQNAFKADSNYQLGFLLFRYVMASHSGRGAITASDAKLSGLPPHDIERFPTRGSMSNTISVYPRGWWRPVEGLEIYGGPLLAWTDVPLVDPLRTRFAGGSPRNAFEGQPGGYLGTEVDLGVRYRHFFSTTELTAALEGGAVFLGSAFQDAGGETPDAIWGARAMLSYRL